MSTYRGVFAALRSGWRKPSAALVRVPDNAVTLYELTPPIWARWVHAIVAVNVMVTTSAIDMVWNAWTISDPDYVPPVDKDPNEPPVKKGNRFQSIPEGNMLAPAWKRAASASFFLVGGIITATALVVARSRIVRTVSFAKSSKDTGVVPSILVQTAAHHRLFGNPFPVRDCTLLPYTKEKMVVEIKENGRWVLDMRGSKIDAGTAAPVDRTQARVLMLKTWKTIGGSTASLPKPPRPPS